MTDVEVIDVVGPVLPEGPNPMGLELPDDLTWDQWVEIGRPVISASIGSRWWLGDWLIYAEDHYATDENGNAIPQMVGAVAEVVAADTALAFQTIKNAKVVSRQFPPYRRRYRVSWSHYAEVASLKNLDDELADSLLRQAEEFDWNRDTLRAEAKRLRDAKAAIPATAKPVEPSVPSRLRFKRPLVIEDQAVRERVAAGIRQVLIDADQDPDLLEVA